MIYCLTCRQDRVRKGKDKKSKNIADLGEPQILVERHKDDPLDARHDHLDDLDEQLHPLLEDDHEGLDTVLRIHDILVWIRIRIGGSRPLTNGPGCGSGSFYFHH